MSADNVAVWRGWDPDFFRGNPVAADWSDHLMANFEDCYGAFNLDQAGVRSLRSFDISPVTDFDDIARGREMLIRDSKYSADLFARAIRSGRETELSPDEMFLAGQSFRESGDTERGRRLIDEAAQAGVSEASVALGLEALGAGRDLEEWAPALPYFRAAAGAGHAHAAFLLGYYYDRMVRAEVGEVDWRALARPTQPGPAEPGEAERQAQHWYEIAAEQGHPRAKARLQESA
jgi:TPR repeat protein